MRLELVSRRVDPATEVNAPVTLLVPRNTSVPSLTNGVEIVEEVIFTVLFAELVIVPMPLMVEELAENPVEALEKLWLKTAVVF